MHWSQRSSPRVYGRLMQQCLVQRQGLRSVTSQATSSDKGPLEDVPPGLSKRLREARDREKNSAAFLPRSEEDACRRSEVRGPLLSELWMGADTGCAGVLDELNKRKAEAAERPVSGDIGAVIEAPRSFLEALNMASLQATPASPAIYSGSRLQSKRSEDERIRADRQQRMEAQGLTGGRGTSWSSRPNENGVEDVGTRTGVPLEPLPSAERGKRTDVHPDQILRHQHQRTAKRGAEVISKDGSYRPTVGTWGVFERPRDISKTYGGGRNLTPEDVAMSAEEKAAYDTQLRQQLDLFRERAGLVVDPVKLAKCEALTAEGRALLDKGQLRGALVALDQASSLVSAKTDPGGQALLLKAITLDSLGQSGEALQLYRQLRGHRCLEVAKMARAMSFGFKAGEFLKADQISYAATREEYDPLFSTLRGRWGWDTVYIASEEEKAEAGKDNFVLALVSFGIVGSPFLLLYVLAFAA